MASLITRFSPKMRGSTTTQCWPNGTQIRPGGSVVKLPLLKSTEISRETSGKFPEVSTRTFKNFQEISTVVLQLPAGAKEVTQVTQGAGELTSAQRVIVALGLVVPASPRWQGCSRSVHGGEKIIVLAERVLKLQDSTTTAGSTEAATPNTVKQLFFRDIANRAQLWL